MKKRHFINTILVLILICLSSCVPQKAIQVQEKRLAVTFKSDTHIICTLSKDMSPSLLAKEFLDDPDKAWMIEDANETARYHAGESIIIPLTIDNKAGLYKHGYQIVPILCYHRFAEDCTSQLCMPEDVFASQMKYLKDHHYRVISMEMLLEYLQYKKAVPKRSVVITIDDGYKSVYTIAYPILKQYEFTASLFIYTDFVAGGSALTWQQIREMKDAGFEVGSHSLSHADLAVKKPTENEKDYILRITREIVRSKEILDKKLDQDTTLFAFPFGSTSQQVINICKKTGYKASLTVVRGGNPFFMNPFLLHRDQILSREQSKFIRRLNTLQSADLEDRDNE